MLSVNSVNLGDCLDVMKQLPDNCIDTVITDPPYGLSFMGKNWDYGIPGEIYWRECLRVAKPGATLLAFGGTRTYHRLVSAIEDAGWLIKDSIVYLNDSSQQQNSFIASLDEEQLAAYLELHYPAEYVHWVYGSGFPKSTDVSKQLDKGYDREIIETKKLPDFYGDQQVKSKAEGFRPYKNGLPSKKHNGYDITKPTTPLAKQFDGFGSAIKPSHEPIVMAQKPNDGTYANNAKEWGVSGLNIDGGRIEASEDDNLQRPNRNGLGVSGGWANYKQPEGMYGTPAGKGRFPANTISDGSEMVEREFAKAGVRVSGKILPSHKVKGWSSEGSHEGYKFKCHTKIGGFETYGDSGSASRFFYTAKSSASERGEYNNHPTVKPLSLLKYLAKLTKTPTGGVILDPFSGSGTTALAAIAEGRDYILIEKESDYVNIALRRIAEYTGQSVPETKEIELSENESTKQLSLW